MTDLPPPGPPPWTPPPLPPIGGRLGPPWERGGPWLTRFVETVREVLLDPVRAFSDMRREGGLQAPLAFAAIGVVAGATASAVYDLLLSGLAGGQALGGYPAMPMFGSAPGTMALLVVSPVVALLTLFVWAGICHLLLMLLDGARQPFETTFRVAAYASGSTALLQVVPFCGALVGAVWNLVVTIIGLAHAHETSLGKAAAAVLVPLAVCCFFVVALALLFGLSLLALLGRNW
jgi:hypothetical protein